MRKPLLALTACLLLAGCGTQTTGVTTPASKPGSVDQARPTPTKAHHTPTVRSVPLSRWAKSSFRGGYLAGRRECSAYTVKFWAEQYHVHADVVSVAMAFGKEHGYYSRDPSLNPLARQAAVQGCIEGFQIRGNR